MYQRFSRPHRDPQPAVVRRHRSRPGSGKNRKSQRRPHSPRGALDEMPVAVDPLFGYQRRKLQKQDRSHSQGRRRQIRAGPAHSHGRRRGRLGQDRGAEKGDRGVSQKRPQGLRLSRQRRRQGFSACDGLRLHCRARVGLDRAGRRAGRDFLLQGAAREAGHQGRLHRHGRLQVRRGAVHAFEDEPGGQLAVQAGDRRFLRNRPGRRHRAGAGQEEFRPTR